MRCSSNAGITRALFLNLSLTPQLVVLDTPLHPCFQLLTLSVAFLSAPLSPVWLARWRMMRSGNQPNSSTKCINQSRCRTWSASRGPSNHFWIVVPAVNAKHTDSAASAHSLTLTLTLTLALDQGIPAAAKTCGMQALSWTWRGLPGRR